MSSSKSLAIGFINIIINISTSDVIISRGRFAFINDDVDEDPLSPNGAVLAAATLFSSSACRIVIFDVEGFSMSFIGLATISFPLSVTSHSLGLPSDDDDNDETTSSR